MIGPSRFTDESTRSAATSNSYAAAKPNAAEKPSVSTKMAASAWQQRKERGSGTLLLFMTRLSLLLGRSLTRPILYFIALYFFAVVRPARMASRQYLNRALGRRATPVDLYKHIFAFTTTIHDRVFLLNDRYDTFDIKHIGTAALHAANANKQGILLFGAHLGSFEVLHTIARINPDIDMYMAMYPENARQINRAMASINPGATQKIIALGQLDATLKINEKLHEGALVGVLADRTSGADKYECLPFLGSDAYFPCGPFRMAAMLRYPVFFMTGLYRGGNRYDVHFELIEDFAQTQGKHRDVVMREIMHNYVATLERHCLAAPFNWFNFFDFWQDHRSEHG